MKLVEQHRISKSHKYFKDIDALCFLAKNLYNKANYDIRQEFIKTSKEKEQGLVDHANWIRYNQIQKDLQNDNQIDYNSLPAKVSQQILMGLDQTWKSFFNSIKDFKKTPAKYSGKPSLPKYKHKTKGRYILTYTIQAISSKLLKKGLVRLSGTDIIIETRKTNIQQVRVVPKNQEYIIEIIYDQEIKINENLNKDLIAGIDIGLNNLASVTSNKIGLRPILINGRPLKSINQFYNKKLAEARSFVGARGTSNRCCRLTNKRNRKTNNYLHNASRCVVNRKQYRYIGHRQK